MRVIVVNDYGFVNGGASQVAISSLNHLARAGIEVIFVSSVGPVDSSIDRSLVNTINFGFHDLLGNPSRIKASFKGLWDQRCANNLKEVLTTCDRRDTIVHLHGWVKSLSSSVARTAIDLGFKVVCTLHDYFTICPNGGLYNFPHKEQCTIRPMSIECIATNCDSRSYSNKLWRVGRQIIQDNFGKIPSGIKYFITVSDYSESLLRPFLPHEAHFFRVSNPIDIEKLSPANVESNLTFAFIGRMSPEKGADIFATASRIADVPSVFAGSGTEQERIANLNPSAQFLGWNNRAGVIRTIQTSRAIVFPSLWHETQGMIVLEAAALGVPALVSDSCAAREAILDGETGLLFRSGDVSDLAAKLTLLQKDSSLVALLGRKAYDRYWKSPSTTAVHVRQLIACYRNILQSRG